MTQNNRDLFRALLQELVDHSLTFFDWDHSEKEAEEFLSRVEEALTNDPK